MSTEEGYYEDLYPDPAEVQSDSSVDVSMESSSDDDFEELTFSKIYGELPEVEVLKPDVFRYVDICLLLILLIALLQRSGGI